ncbi:CcdB family protein [Sulfitobacter aestuarii]|uniref:Toxin CcdB n=1 Tax=Sulfitobacter aestuarii TaxID=2161676 RepID=A0ABW5U2R9_9RHOB
MAQFQVYALAGGRLVLDLQTDLIDTGSRVVAPLVALGAGPRPLTRLEPIIEIDGTEYALHTAEMAAIPARLMRDPPVSDLSARDYEIRGALDMVFSGF